MSAVATGLRLNLGAADHRPTGFATVDLEKHPDYRVDLAAFPWPWSDESVSEILASHILEHFDKATGKKFLEECRRILARGGVLRVAVPDLDKFIACRLSGDWSSLAGYKWTDLNWLLGGDEREGKAHHRHRYMYTYESLAYLLEGMGFRWVKQRGPCELDNPRYHAISLYVDALV